MIDLTNEFFSYANEKPNHHESTVNRSAFLQASQSIDYELKKIKEKMSNLEVCNALAQHSHNEVRALKQIKALY